MKMLKYFGTPVLGLTLAAGPIYAGGDKTADFYGSVNPKSAYVTRTGITAVDNPVIQGKAGVKLDGLKLGGLDLSGLDANVWTNYNPDTNGVTEIDFNVEYSRNLSNNSRSLPNVGFNIQYQHFIFPDLGIPSAHEVNGSIQTKEFPVDVGIYAAWNWYKTNSGGYLGPFAETDFKIGDFTVNVTGDIGFNHYYFRDKSGFSHVHGKASTQVDIFGLDAVTEINFKKSLRDDISSDVYFGVGFPF